MKTTKHKTSMKDMKDPCPECKTPIDRRGMKAHRQSAHGIRFRASAAAIPIDSHHRHNGRMPVQRERTKTDPISPVYRAGFKDGYDLALERQAA